MDAKALVVSVERAAALDMVDVARVLADREPMWCSETFEIADGHAVLLGPGLYVNRVLAAGLEADVNDVQLDLLQERSRAVGVPPALEVNEHTSPSVAPLLAAHGFRAGRATAWMFRSLDGDLAPCHRSVEVEVVDAESLAAWQAATAIGWGHLDVSARGASDAFAAAAFEVQSPGLLLARSANDGRILGCASLSLRDDLATLGAMSTLPDERGKGVQAALIAARLRLAADAGFKLAATSVAPGSGSQRNLARHGFVPSHTNTTWEL